MKQRAYTGEKDGRVLAAWLNEKRETHAGIRIKVMLTVLHLLSKTAPAFIGDPRTADLAEVVSSLHRFWKSRPELQVRIEGGSNRPNKMSPAEMAQLLLERVGLPKIRAHVAVQYRGSGTARRAFFVLDADDDESAAVLKVLALSQRGVLDRIERCRCCGKWFFARFRHQHFCQTKCQQKHYRKSAEWKAHRREWARDYYKKNRTSKIS